MHHRETMVRYPPEGPCRREGRRSASKSRSWWAGSSRTTGPRRSATGRGGRARLARRRQHDGGLRPLHGAWPQHRRRWPQTRIEGEGGTNRWTPIEPAPLPNGSAVGREIRETFFMPPGVPRRGRQIVPDGPRGLGVLLATARHAARGGNGYRSVPARSDYHPS